MKIRFPAFAAFLLLAAVPAAAQTPPVAMTDADPALWVVKDADTTIYLFGTIHVLKPGLSWFDEAVKTAFDASDALVIEMVTPSATEMLGKVNQYAVDPQKRALTSLLTEADRKAYIAATEANHIPYQAFESYKPWFVAVTLGILPLQTAGYGSADGVETVLTEAAKAAGKPVTGLETVDQQLGLFDALPQADQIIYLNATVKGLPDMVGEIDTLVGLWAKGETRKLAKNMNEADGMTPALNALLLKDRNARWAEWIATRLDTPGTVFVAVGSGHLAGRDSVQTMLKRKTLKAVRVRY